MHSGKMQLKVILYDYQKIITKELLLSIEIIYLSF